MNLLPFVMIVIMVLSLFSLSQFENALIKKKENQIYCAYFKGLRKARNDKIETAYKNSLGKKTKDGTLPKEENKKKISHKYFREKRVGWEKGRLNLSSLLKKPHKYPKLEAIAVEYVKRLYSHAQFFPKDDQTIKDLIRSLIKEHQKDPSTSFDKVIFNDPKLQHVFYKMRKGTNTYELEHQRGYPPFGEMFTFEKNDRPPMNYHYANLSFLTVIFGEKITKDFVKTEKEGLVDSLRKCESPIKKPALESLLSNQAIEGQSALLELFDFLYKTSEKIPEKNQDDATRITVKVQ